MAKTGLAPAAFCCCCVGAGAPRRPPTTIRWRCPPSIRACSCARSGCACCKRERERDVAALAAVRDPDGGRRPHAGTAASPRRSTTRWRATPRCGRKAVAWALGPGSRSAPAGPGLRLVPGSADRGAAARPRRRACERASRDTAADDASPPCARACWPRWRSSTMCRRAPQRELERVVHAVVGAARWSPALTRRPAAWSPRDDAYALLELLHAVRDNTNLDLRESVPRLLQGLSHRTPDELLPGRLSRRRRTTIYIGATRKTGEPDLQAGGAFPRGRAGHGGLRRQCAESQVLQGWLMHDHFMLRGTFGRALRVSVGQSRISPD